VRTALTELLGIEAPIVLAPMGGAVTPELAAAVSNAGGLGVIPLSYSTPDEIKSTVGEITALTDRPFGINLILEWEQRERLAAALDAGVPAISLFWGDVSELVPQAHDGGAVVFVSVGSVDEAVRAAAPGADVVVARGGRQAGMCAGRSRPLRSFRAWSTPSIPFRSSPRAG